MMSEHRGGVLAGQETKVRSASIVAAMSELTNRGTTATMQATQATGGVGFLIHRSAEEMVANHGPRPRALHSSATRKFAAAWARIYGDAATADVYMASVYKLHASEPTAVYHDALRDLEADMAYYCQKPGSVVLAGDFTAWVAHAGHAHLEPELAAAAPRYGDNYVNARGLALSRMCSRLGLHFRSGA